MKKNKTLKLIIAGAIITCTILTVTGCGKKTNEVTEYNKENDVSINQNTNEQKNSTNVESQNKNVTNNIVSNTAKNSTATNISANEKVDGDNGEALVKDLFLKDLKNNNEKNSEKLIDYRVESVKIIKGEERKNLISQFYPKATSKAFFAEVTYSVKPKDVNNTGWIAGNGDIDGDWITNKSQCIYADIKNDSYAIISSGTGW